jgi:hypothetical protein
MSGSIAALLTIGFVALMRFRCYTLRPNPAPPPATSPPPVQLPTPQQLALKASVTALPTHTHVGEASEDECAVCLNAFEAGEHCKALPCSHVFHAYCIDKWLVDTVLSSPNALPTCPFCKQVVLCAPAPAPAPAASPAPPQTTEADITGIELSILRSQQQRHAREREGETTADRVLTAVELPAAPPTELLRSAEPGAAPTSGSAPEPVGQRRSQRTAIRVPRVGIRRSA